MTAALDPDYGTPFLSNTTVQSFRDLGYKVVAFYGPGDLDSDADMDVDDIDLLVHAINSQSDDIKFDLDRSEIVDKADLHAWLTANGTVNGDVNLDQRVNAADLNAIGTNWRSQHTNGWSGGDFNGGGITDSADLNQLGLSWRFGDAEQAPVAANVPEPALGTMTLVWSFSFWVFLRRSLLNRK